MGTELTGTGWGPSLWGWGVDGVAMGTGTTVTVGDRDELLSPCSSLLL